MLSQVHVDVFRLDRYRRHARIGSQVGVVRLIGMRFTILENSLGVMVYIPNCSIGDLINYPQGYVRCLIDVTLMDDKAISARITDQTELLMGKFAE